MKAKLYQTLTVLLVLLAFAPNTFAQDYTQLGLPEGAKVRLGKGWVGEIAYSPDGTRLAVASGIGIFLYDTQTCEELNLLTGHTSWGESVVFSPNGNTIASADGQEINFWDAHTGTQLRTLIGHTDWIESVAFSPDGNTIASASWGATFRLSDAKTGIHLRIPTGHTATVAGVAFSPDGNILASASWDGTVLLWEIVRTAPDPEKIAEDINIDGIVNIQDLVLVASNFGETGQNAADVNNDGIVNIVDLTLVAGAIGNTVGAPLTWRRNLEFAPIREQVDQWLHQARQVNLTDSDFQQGLLVLEQLLAMLTPKETALLPNYPNPFNPETWIPYQLAEPAEVTVSIHSADGRLVWTLVLGHQPVGIYASRSHSVYWDGRNTLGELVASGVYFYTLMAGEFTATRKMLIRK